MPRTPKKHPHGKAPGSVANHFKPGHGRIGGKEPRRDVWAAISRAAEIATERARKEGKEVNAAMTADELMSDLIDTVKRYEPEKALRCLAPLVYPKSQYKPLSISVNLETDEGVAQTLKQITEAMASGKDIASLKALMDSVVAFQQSQALAVEIELSRKELDA